MQLFKSLALNYGSITEVFPSVLHGTGVPATVAAPRPCLSVVW